MIITRWQASVIPSREQIQEILQLEGLDPVEEVFNSNVKIQEHRHPFCEIRVVVEGELLFNISGNQFALRAGDRVEIPANTRHSHSNMSRNSCLCLCAQRVL